MSDDLFECRDCGHVGEPAPKSGEQPFHTCTGCGSGYLSRIDIAGDMERLSRHMDSMRSRGFDMGQATVNDSGIPEVVFRHGNWLGRYSGGNIDIAHQSDPSRSVDMINNMEDRKSTRLNSSH